MGQITVFSGPERRRWWTGSGVRSWKKHFRLGLAWRMAQHGVSTALIYTWRRKLRQLVAEPGFAEPVVVDDGPGARACNHRRAGA